MQPRIPQAGTNLSSFPESFCPGRFSFLSSPRFYRAGHLRLVQPGTLPDLSKQAGLSLPKEATQNTHPFPSHIHPFPSPPVAPLFSPCCQRMLWGICEFLFYKTNNKSVSSHLHSCYQQGFNPLSPPSQSRGRDEPPPPAAPKPPP